MAGLCTLAQLEFDHLDLRICRLFGEADRIETAIGSAASEIAAANFPDKVATIFAVIGADAAFTRIVREVPETRALVERTNGVRAQRPEAHCGDVEDRCHIGRSAMVTADGYPEGGRIGDWGGPRGMSDELVTVLVDVDERAESPITALVLGARVDEGALRS